MKTKRLIKFIVNMTLLFSCFVFAQNTNRELTGSIIDIATQEALIGVPVTITQEENTIKELLSDEEGKFKTQLPKGQYNLIVEEFGYEKKVQALQIVDSLVNLGTIPLKKVIAEKTLDGVVVTGKRKTTIVNEIDRKVVTVGDDLSAASQDLSQIMNTIPGVYVNQDNQISLRGNSNVKVLVDGKPTTMTFDQLMKQYPPDLIDKIEVLTNPPAKYSPEGKSGIINIILKKGAKKGTNINLNTSYIYGAQSKYVNGIDFNQVFEKFNLFGNGGYNDWTWQNSGYLLRSSNNSRQDYKLMGDYISRYGKIGFDYFINDKNTLSLYTYQSGNSSDMNSTSKETNSLGNSTIINQTQDADIRYQEYDLFYKSEFSKPGHKLEVQANYNSNEENTLRDYVGIKQKLDEKEDNYRVGIDYTNPLSETSELTAGAEVRLNRFRNDYGIDQINYYEFQRDIYSLYAEYKKQWDRFQFKAGIRGEYFDTRTNTDFPNSSNIRDYTYQFYPTLHTSYKLGENKKTEISLNYSRRVDRPWAGLYSPVPQLTVGTIVITGNGNIKPEYTNSFEAGISTNLPKLYLGINMFYRDIKDQITERFIEHPNYIELVNENTQGNNQYGGELDINYNPFKWWSINSGFEYYWGKASGTIQDVWYERNISNYFFRVNNTLTLPKSFSVQILGQYQSPNQDLQSDYKEQWKIDASVKKSFMGDKLSFTLRVSDIFNTMHSEYTTLVPSRIDGRSDWESRRISLAVKYNFSSGKIKKTERKNVEDNTKKGGGLM